ncbi:IclR family transcriptional regulator [Citricoccus sp. NR2]|uniref:IclR family transcriptional regulator n=1 Tax=Citricoccus sp. NR2 TaxID=3004095 RepID=UPI0022DDE4F7|nr:IclR family transcriptional regulator [Citricoccus sp. NR2]WBL19590.1 IclR family transcriptional regulator [Citricoccus sp. NR2]
MNLALSRSMAVIERLAGEADGVPLMVLATELDLPKSAAHRILADLIGLGYVHQDHVTERYRLSMKLVSITQRHLSQVPLVDLAQPVLTRLAEQAGELARMSVLDEDELIWITKAQGSKHALRYDPDSGQTVDLLSTASGLALLSTLNDDDARSRLRAQPKAPTGARGPGAPQSEDEFIERLAQVRSDGFAYISNSYELGIAALAAPIVDARGSALGVVNLVGPSLRFDRETALTHVADVQRAAQEISAALNTTL